MVQPQTKSAWLVNKAGRYTRHFYVRTEPVLVTLREETANASIAEHKVIAMAFMFACSETNEVRVWGVQ